jgi:hypothetical protein
VNICEDLPAPGLALVFNSHGTYPFLRKAFFKSRDGKHINTQLVEDPPGPKFLCALCIFILLAKFKGANPLNPDQQIVLRDENEQLSWLNTLAVDQRVLRSYENSYFSGYHFFTASRGTARRVPAFARFEPSQLKLDSVRLYRMGPDSSSPVRLNYAEIPKFAAKLEEYGLRLSSKKWVATVKRQVEDIEIVGGAIRMGEPKRVSSGHGEEMEGCRISPMWRTLFDESLSEIAKRGFGGEWYVVCNTPYQMLQWRHHFSDAVERGAIVKFAYYGESSPDACPSIAAQMKMNIEHLRSADPIGQLKTRIRDCESELASLEKDARKKGFKGKFEFYVSHLSHPLNGILIVPSPFPKAGVENHPAPKGTECLLALQTFYPRSVDQRVGLHFYQPSRSLNIYYNSIRRLFLRGRRDQYLKLGDRIKTLRSGKGTS